ncbi:MAG: esterase [Parasporobacterium sp.]|nr:esterase [Parasporobacterium sp.]
MNPCYYGNPKANTVLIQMADDPDLSVMEQEVEHIRRLTGREDFLLAAIGVDNWNGDLSPWAAPPVFGKEPFGDGAENTLEYLKRELIPSLPEPEGGQQRTFFIGGYSLAGLFALWAVFRTDLFAGAAAASPSVWFPSFRDYVSSHPLKTKAVYLSLGDKEEKTRNPVMAQVGDAIREIYGNLQRSSMPCRLEWNQGNHFREPELRTAKGFSWLMKGCPEHC